MKKGFAPILAIVLALAVLGGGYWLATKTGVIGGSSLDSISVSLPDFDLSASPLPKLNTPSLNLVLPSFPQVGSFSGVSMDTKIDMGDIAKVDVAVPETNIDISSYVPKNIPTIPSIPSVGKENVPATPTQAPAGAGAPAIDCSMFSSVPSCSMTGSGYDLCKQCYPNR